MKQIIALLLLLSILIMPGCGQQTELEGVDFPFDAGDVKSIEAYYYLENFTDSARKKVVTEPETIEFLFTTFHTLSMQPASIDPNKYGANISAYRFLLADGTSYELVYEGYGIKDGIITTQDMEPHFTAADINALWLNMTVDAGSCAEQELPLPYWDRTAPETAPTIIYTNEEADVYQLVLDFLAAKQTDFQSEEHLSLAEYYSPDVRDTLEEQLSWKVFRFEKLVRAGMLDKILWEECKASVNDIQINGETAVVNAFESYEYELSAADGAISSRGTTLIFSCQKIQEEWFITEIDTDNELIESHVAGYSAEELPALAGVSE